MLDTKLILLAISIVCCLQGCRDDAESTKKVDQEEAVRVFPSFSKHHPPPSDSKQIFSLSQDYPKSYNDQEIYPWDSIDFKVRPENYMKVVLKYCLEGNIEVAFAGQDNSVRKWYHAPYMHDDGDVFGNGREYIHGLTRERGTPKFEIHDLQNVELENWAVGMYNAPGGNTLHNVWHTEGAPNFAHAEFPEGTVSFKLLFTDGTAEKVPFLKGSLEWEANIYPSNPAKNKVAKRENRTVRLLQIDIAVKDLRAEKTGWVFGTFMYDGSVKSDRIWERIVPVGLSWGDDSSIFDEANVAGSYINPKLEETYLNPELIKNPDQIYTDEVYMKYYGLGGRLNGPVDNPISSCISCHGQSGVQNNGKPLPLANFSLKPSTFTRNEFDKYFSDVRGGAYKRHYEGEIYNMTDYSLQLAFGIRNYYQEIIDSFNHIAAVESGLEHAKDHSASLAPHNLKNYINSLPKVTRGEQ